MTVRIKMPKGHQELCLEGHTYHPSPEDGAFEVPDHMKDFLIHVHGGEIAADVQQLEIDADAAELRLAQHHARTAVMEEDAATARSRADAAKTKAATARRVLLTSKDADGGDGNGAPAA